MRNTDNKYSHPLAGRCLKGAKIIEIRGKEPEKINVTQKKRKLPYVPPVINIHETVVEDWVAAGSITVKEDDNVVEESWIEESDDRRTINLDFFD